MRGRKKLLISHKTWSPTEVEPDPDYRRRLRRVSAFFFRTRIRKRSQKFVKNRTRSHFSISAVAGVCAVIFSENTWVNYGWIDDCSQSLSESRILNFEEWLDPDPDSKILEQERSQSLKK